MDLLAGPGKKYFHPLGYDDSADALTDNLYLLLKRDKREKPSSRWAMVRKLPMSCALGRLLTWWSQR